MSNIYLGGDGSVINFIRKKMVGGGIGYIVESPEKQVTYALEHHARVEAYNYDADCRRKAISRSKKQARKSARLARRKQRRK